jgi:hypothetical protein
MKNRKNRKKGEGRREKGEEEAGFKNILYQESIGS